MEVVGGEEALTHSPDVDDLKGRDLDAMVARYVFDLEVEPRVNARTRERDAVCRLPNGEWVRVAFYSGSMGASLNVQLALRDRGWTRKEPTGKVSGDVRVILEHADGRTVEATGPMNVALCRAALKAVEIV